MRILLLLCVMTLALPCSAGSLYISQRNPLPAYGLSGYGPTRCPGGADDDGLANGGTSLFAENVVTLWGSQQNAISVLSLGMLAAPETTAVPESGTLAFVGVGMAVMAWLRGL